VAEPVLSVRNLQVFFDTKYGHATAIRNIDFDVCKGEIIGIVGESGSGKTVISKSIMRLLQSPPANITGEIILDGENLLTKTEAEMCEIRGKRISMIFQEPMVSLDPLFSIGNQMTEVIPFQNKMTKKQKKERIIEMLHKVGIPSPETRLKQYPFELSGGMRQRVMIAMALMCNPEVLIADEPTTALDVTIQAQILDLLNNINTELGTSILLITHDLGVIAEMVDRVIVVYAGNVVECASVHDIFKEPLHPYTEGLLRSIPSMDDSSEMLETIEGSVPSIYERGKGCSFCNRCKISKALCAEEEPPVVEHNGSQVKCWKYTAQW